LEETQIGRNITKNFFQEVDIREGEYLYAGGRIIYQGALTTVGEGLWGLWFEGRGSVSIFSSQKNLSGFFSLPLPLL